MKLIFDWRGSIQSASLEVQTLAKMISTGFIAVFLLATICNCVADAGLCGQAKSDPAKTCISIRLPWKPEPIYFCTEKFTHQPACGGHGYQTPNVCGNSYSNTSLLIATPWDCCPLQSQPVGITDACKDIKCTPKPIGRTCIDLRNNSSGPISRYEATSKCCPQWFCEEDMDVESPSCTFKVLEPGCNQAPKDKTNCVGFYDEYGCCPKFQCDGEGKPGVCPAAGAMQHTAHHYGVVHHRHHHHSRAPKLAEPIACVGDHTCPGTMKCCSQGATYSMTAEGAYTSVFGYCLESAAATGKNSAEEEAVTESSEDESSESPVS